MEIDKDKIVASIKAGSGQSSRRTSDDLSELERDLVRRFFAKVEVIYGKARCQSVWPDQASLNVAMREWALDIVKYGEIALQRKFNLLKTQMDNDLYRFPDIGAILRIDHQPGQGGTAAESYRPVSEALAALPPPPMSEEEARRRKSAGQKALDAMRADLAESVGKKQSLATQLQEKNRQEIIDLMAKHGMDGTRATYQRPVKDWQGKTHYVPTDIAHPMRSLASEGREFCFMDQRPEETA